MAFVNQLFPNLKLIHGLVKGVSLPTKVVGNSAIEYRIRKLANYRTTWTWPGRGMLATDRRAVVEFYTEVASFSLNSFKFKDPDLHSWNLTPLTYTGSNNQFYLTTAGANGTHPIFHLDADVVVRNGTTPVSFTKTVVNGVPVVTVPGYTSNVNISGTFYHAARFNQGTLEWTLEALDSTNQPLVDILGDIGLIEVFEY